MIEHKFINIIVKCPREICSVYPMQVHLVDPDGQGLFPLKVNGCDYYNGSEHCEKCRTFITNRFIDDLYYFPGDIISPGTPTR